MIHSELLQMSLLFFLTGRFITNGKQSKNYSFFSIISVTGIALGVATLVIALTVLNGFEEVITEKLTSIDSHINVFGVGGTGIIDNQVNIESIVKIVGSDLENVHKYINRLAIISNKRIKEGISIKGVPFDYFLNKPDLKLVAGSLDLSSKLNSDSEKIFIGKKLADKLLVTVDQTITVFALQNDRLPSATNMPNIKKYVVGGIFESGMAKYDDSFAYMAIDRAADLFKMNNYLNGYEIKLKKLSKLDSIKLALRDHLDFSASITTFKQTNRQVFNWIELQRKPIPIVLGLIILVAVFNIVSTLLLIILEKTQTIGILKSMGASNGLIVKVFLLRGVFIGLGGSIIGSVLSYGLLIIQKNFEVIKLPSSIYFLSKVPLAIHLDTFLIVSVISLILCMLVSFIPAFSAARISPLQSLRFR